MTRCALQQTQTERKLGRDPILVSCSTEGAYFGKTIFGTVKLYIPVGCVKLISNLADTAKALTNKKEQKRHKFIVFKEENSLTFQRSQYIGEESECK